MEFNATFLASIVSFLVFVFLMNKILYAPVERIVAERKLFIEGNYESADKNHQKADELTQQREEKLADAKDNARLAYADSVNGFKEQRDGIVQKAHHETGETLDRELKALENLSNETKEGLKGRISELAGDIAEKVLGYRTDIQGFDNDTVNRILYH